MALSYRAIPFKHVANGMKLLPNTVLPYINKWYINNPHSQRCSNFTPIIFVYPTFTAMIESHSLKRKQEAHVNSINNTVYFRNISTPTPPYSQNFLLRVWFQYRPREKHLDFISIYELTNDIDSRLHYKHMSRYYSTINDNKLYPDFNPENLNTFITDLQKLF